MPHIVLDPGHGGSEVCGSSSPQGGRGPSGTLEKHVTLELARRIARHLGSSATLTRDGDRNLSLGERIDVARRHGARVFVSLHANHGDPARPGPTAYVHTAADAPSSQLATMIGRQLGSRYGAPAVSRGDLAVLSPHHHHTGTAACLIEAGCLEDRDGEHRLQDPRYLDELGGAMARGIREYCNRYGFGTLTAPVYNPANAAESLAALESWQNNLNQWLAGVPRHAHAFYPHNAICKLVMDGRGHGSGWYIGGNKILTAGHCVSGVRSMKIMPGQHGNSSTNAREVTVDSTYLRLYPGYVGANAGDGGATDLGLILLPEDHPFGPVRAFTPKVLDQCPSEGLIVTGYGAETTVEDRNAAQLSFQIDPWVQHLSSGPFTLHDDTAEAIKLSANIARGTSGSPVYYIHEGRAWGAGVLVGYGPGTHNLVCAFTQAKLDWIHRQ
jgi:V8-like Glu-specific endopeptidase